MQALVALRGLGADALPPLYAFATNRAKPLLVRRAAMDSIGMLRYLGTNEEWVVQAIIPYLSEEEMAEPTARALRGMGMVPSVSVPALRKAAASKNPNVRVWAVISLGRFVNEAEQAIPELTDALVDPDPRVRQEASNALERIAPGIVITNGQGSFKY
jgi:HEAT repeat protein